MFPVPESYNLEEALELIQQNHAERTDIQIRDDKLRANPALIEQLCDALQNNTHLNSLNLSLNNINDEGFKQLIDCIFTSKVPICTLNLHSNYITDQGLQALNERSGQLPWPLKINLKGNRLSPDYNHVIALASCNASGSSQLFSPPPEQNSNENTPSPPVKPRKDSLCNFL